MAGPAVTKTPEGLQQTVDDLVEQYNVLLADVTAIGAGIITIAGSAPAAVVPAAAGITPKYKE